MTSIFADVYGGEANVSVTGFLICLLTAIFIGGAMANIFMYKSNSSKSYAITLAVLPLAVSVVVLLVSDNFGAGLAIAGAFSLLKFKSQAGSGKEMIGILLAVASGIACGTGYVVIALLFATISLGLYVAYCRCPLWQHQTEKMERILLVSTEYRDESDDVSDQIQEIVFRHAENVSREGYHIEPGKKNTKLTISYKLAFKSADEEDALMKELKYSGLNASFELSRLKRAGVKRL